MGYNAVTVSQHWIFVRVGLIVLAASPALLLRLWAGNKLAATKYDWPVWVYRLHLARRSRRPRRHQTTRK